jgi:tetrachlorobenzoquinone reductase
MSDGIETMKARVQAMRLENESVLLIEFRAPDGQDLPAFEAGAHIDLFLPNGLLRSYSLSNSQDETHRYVVGVSRDAKSRGGSDWIHDNLRLGQVLEIAAPRNNFPLKENADHSILFAGGIGITPMLSMVRRLTDLGRSWELYYCVRTRDLLALQDELAQVALQDSSRIHLHVDAENDGRVLDIPGIVSAAPAGTHMYCCGPLPMIAGFEEAIEGRGSEFKHVEYFAAKEAPKAEGGFEVELTESGVTLQIQAGKTILNTMLDAGLDAPFSCGEGICGTCETRVISGIPDHHDLVLTDSEKESNETVMICCAGSKSPRLVLQR